MSVVPSTNMVVFCYNSCLFCVRVCVCVCACPLGAAYRITDSSVSRNTSGHRIYQIDSAGAEITMIACANCTCLSCARAVTVHKPVLPCGTWMYRVFLFAVVYLQLLPLFKECVCVCVCLEMSSVLPGPSAFYVKKRQEQGGSVQVASRVDNSYELWTCFISRHHHKQKTWLLSVKPSAINTHACENWIKRFQSVVTSIEIEVICLAGCFSLSLNG